MAEQCRDCHWFKGLLSSAQGGTCRKRAPGPGGFPTVRADDRCGQFKLAISVPKSERGGVWQRVLPPAGRHGAPQRSGGDISTGGGDSAEGRTP